MAIKVVPHVLRDPSDRVTPAERSPDHVEDGPMGSPCLPELRIVRVVAQCRISCEDVVYLLLAQIARP